ncbi:3-phosphoshikimate 1-carboxyvinyltransferase (EC [Olavius algarvensis associated proteobacterium Delta 3]|nr:3-phosphoshikimate 1-carboxyvinyltransferase (EC [Olavius algarvensis associated proteobacterium Delta 3]CAB5155557.1 3-phosphoshikimate 1-carboxyvinyltransferase (EC [Olavius algarvensis associated proteobacterium Delta 3]
MIDIISGPLKDFVEISVPGSKSFTHRMLIAAALSGGKCTVENCLDSEDTQLTRAALTQLGVKFQTDPDRLVIYGQGGKWLPNPEPLFLGNSGTSMRLLAAVVALGTGVYRLMGTTRMHARPIQDLLDALNQLDVTARSMSRDGCPPVEIHTGTLRGGSVSIDCGTSSQYLSGLLLMAPILERGLEIHVTKGPVSRPYIDMTLQVMAQFGIRYERDGYRQFKVFGKQRYQPGDYAVEPDASQASYFWAAAAVSGTTVKVTGLPHDSIQGDLRIIELLEAMGCEVDRDSRGISVTGGPLAGVDVDMGDMPDMVPTLAVVAAFAQGPTRIRNVAHLKVKESDRLGAVTNELAKMGIEAHPAGDDLIVHGGAPKGAVINTYNDHRIAMSFSVVGLRSSGVRIENEGCVAKSFPTYWEVFRQLYS